MFLLNEGSVKVGGGCVAYRQGAITLRPAGGEVEVVVDNDQGFFYADGQPVPSYTRRLPAAAVEPFLREVKARCEAPRPEPWPSTGAATVVVDLPLNTGRVSGRFAEAHDRKDRDPLLDAVRGFVEANAPR